MLPRCYITSAGNIIMSIVLTMRDDNFLCEVIKRDEAGPGAIYSPSLSLFPMTSFLQSSLSLCFFLHCSTHIHQETQWSNLTTWIWLSLTNQICNLTSLFITLYLILHCVFFFFFLDLSVRLKISGKVKKPPDALKYADIKIVSADPTHTHTHCSTQDITEQISVDVFVCLPNMCECECYFHSWLRPDKDPSWRGIMSVICSHPSFSPRTLLQFYSRPCRPSTSTYFVIILVIVVSLFTLHFSASPACCLLFVFAASTPVAWVKRSNSDLFSLSTHKKYHSNWNSSCNLKLTPDVKLRNARSTSRQVFAPTHSSYIVMYSERKRGNLLF